MTEIREDVHTQRVDGRRCGVVQSRSAGTEPLGTGLKQLTEDGEAGIGRQRALSPGLMMIKLECSTE